MRAFQNEKHNDMNVPTRIGEINKNSFWYKIQVFQFDRNLLQN